MYSRRLKILVVIVGIFALVCILRLAAMQLLSGSFYREQIEALKLQRSSSKQLRTGRGRILDRYGRVLAVDEPRFQLCIHYRAACVLDERVKRAELLRAEGKPDAADRTIAIENELENGTERLQQIMDKCAQFGRPRNDIEDQIVSINNRVWNLRSFVAWARSSPPAEILEKYGRNLNTVPLAEAIADFETRFPDANQRLRLIDKVSDIANVDRAWPLFELKTEDDVFAAQLEFLDVNGVEVLAKAHRVYPCGSDAAQVIGWVGPPQQRDKDALAADKLSSYLDDEVCGREDGVEYACETILRGKRGELVYDIDDNLVSSTQTQFGSDVLLTIDIELQRRIADYIADCSFNPNCALPTAAVVIDVNSCDVLASVSLPSYDLNLVRQNYSAIADDPNEPFRNRVLNKHYQPGSVVKPLILIAGLESGQITADEVISCPARKAPAGWPSCWIYNRYNWLGHDDLQETGGNKARNAIKGSCNIYFSRLADRIDPLVLQSWLFRFGYGHKTPLFAPTVDDRDFRQAQGQISNILPGSRITSFEQTPALEPTERRWFGIGHGNLRATLLQVANAMAVLARGGTYKPARLILDINDASYSENDRQSSVVDDHWSADLGISRSTLAVVYDGMRAVVAEQGGTAYKEFEPARLDAQGVKVFGKTGSTEKPDNAWFAGFAKDNSGRAIVVAVLVEGGQQGSSDACPLARDIIQFCIEAGYIGPNLPRTD